jgi:hypothetical protein
LWQRDWTPAVNDALTEAQHQLDGVVILGGEINWSEKGPSVVRSNIDWDTLQSRGLSCALALRVSPFRGEFDRIQSKAKFIADTAKSLINIAAAHHVALGEFQLDFDCPQKNLANYRAWLTVVREAVHPTRLVITTLPAWLEEPEFRLLLAETDGFVLQVHSVPVSNRNTPAKLCDTVSARRWVERAAQLGRPFSVALPTYRCSAGYDGNGKLLSVAMDSIQPAWPPGTRVLEFGAPASEIAGLVADWQKTRPREMREIIWYRIPVATDLRNWRWPTLTAVMSGRTPSRRLDVLIEGSNPIDLSIGNTGEDEQQSFPSVTASTGGEPVVAADALPGWTVQIRGDRAIFRTTGESEMRLSPGDKRSIGWIRCQQPASFRVALSEEK